MSFLPAILGAVVDMISGNVQNKAANANNDNQKKAAQEWLMQYMKQALGQAAPWMTPGQTPFAGAQLNKPTPTAPPGAGSAANVLSGASTGPQPAQLGAGSQPPVTTQQQLPGPPRHQMGGDPRQAMVQQMLQHMQGNRVA